MACREVDYTFVPRNRRALPLTRWTGRLGAVITGVSGVAVTVVSGLVVLAPVERWACLAIGLALVLAAVVLARVRWERARRRSLLVGPALIVLAVGTVGVLAESSTQPLISLLLLVVLYVGFTQPQGTTLAFAPFMVADWWFSFPTHPSWLVLRLPLVVAVFTVIGESVAWAQRRSTSEIDLLRESTLTDPLTGIGNRRALTHHLPRFRVGGVVLFLDLDHFKEFNDRNGHAAGDALLVEFAAVLRSVLRASDVLVRFGGEEFVILLDGAVEGTDVYERVRDAWNAVGGSVTFSAGLARRAEDEAPAITVARADQALYRAKVNGRNRIELSGPRGLPEAVTGPGLDAEQAAHATFARLGRQRALADSDPSPWSERFAGTGHATSGQRGGAGEA